MGYLPNNSSPFLEERTADGDAKVFLKRGVFTILPEKKNGLRCVWKNGIRLSSFTGSKAVKVEIQADRGDPSKGFVSIGTTEGSIRRGPWIKNGLNDLLIELEERSNANNNQKARDEKTVIKNLIEEWGQTSKKKAGKKGRKKG
jgi:hypothetical protein